MSIAFAIITKDEEEQIAYAVQQVEGFADEVFVYDTGSSDDTVKLAKKAGAKVTVGEWHGFGEARTHALALAHEHDWILMADADMLISRVDNFKAWLEEDPDPMIDAWQVQVVDGALSWWVPLLVRGGLDWRYVGPAHEYLDPAGRPQRQVLGLYCYHWRARTPERNEQYLDLLRPEMEAREPRATYYYAETLWCLGRVEEAVEVFNRRASMTGTWEEERWHASYMAAKLTGDIGALMASWHCRPHRHEPLSEAARLVQARGTQDVLFLETP